eukprot:911120-Pyramimonas_sp.AAC.1
MMQAPKLGVQVAEDGGWRPLVTQLLEPIPPLRIVENVVSNGGSVGNIHNFIMSKNPDLRNKKPGVCM